MRGQIRASMLASATAIRPPRSCLTSPHARAPSFQSSVAAVRWSSVGGPVRLVKAGPASAAGALASGSARSAATSSNGEQLHGRRH
jgi:hypothetical protein